MHHHGTGRAVDKKRVARAIKVHERTPLRCVPSFAGGPLPCCCRSRPDSLQPANANGADAGPVPAAPASPAAAGQPRTMQISLPILARHPGAGSGARGCTSPQHSPCPGPTSWWEWARGCWHPQRGGTSAARIPSWTSLTTTCCCSTTLLDSLSSPSPTAEARAQAWARRSVWVANSRDAEAVLGVRAATVCTPGILQ